MDALLDIEYVQANKSHQCIRKLAILLEDGETFFVREFRPCMPWRSLELKYKKSFDYCRRNIHHLEYNPRCAASNCADAIDTVRDILEWNNVSRVLYKGGNIERKLCQQLGMPSKNIEDYGAPKATSHDPLGELKEHHAFLQSRRR